LRTLLTIIALLVCLGSRCPDSYVKAKLTRLTVNEIIAIKESSNGKYPYNFDSTCIGKYHIQWWIARKFGYSKTKAKFIKDHKIQDTIFKKLWDSNAVSMKYYVYKKNGMLVYKHLSKKYCGKYVRGVLLDEELILVGAFFAGSKYMTDYLLSNGKKDVGDGFSKISEYISDYNRYRNQVVVVYKNEGLVNI